MFEDGICCTFYPNLKISTREDLPTIGFGFKLNGDYTYKYEIQIEKP